MEFNLLISNLDTLNKIKIYDKINIINNTLTIDKVSIFRFIIRYFKKQTREKVYVFIIKLINNLKTELDKFVYFQEGKSKYNINEINIKNWSNYHEIFCKLADLKKTVYILKNTYSNDKEYLKKLDILKNIIKNIQNHLKATIKNNMCNEKYTITSNRNLIDSPKVNK